MIATLVNCAVIIAGCIIGLIIKGGIPERVSNIIMNALALCVIYIGISGALESTNTLVTIISMAAGALIGELIDIDKYINNLGNIIQNKFSNGKNSGNKIAEGFVTSSLLFCVGAMAIVGALQAGLSGDYETLYAKSVLDGISSIIFSASLGIGVIFSTVTVFIYQGLITVGASFLSSVLSDGVIAGMTATGSLMIVGLGLNLLGVTNIKIANMLPGVIIPIIFGMFGVI